MPSLPGAPLPAADCGWTADGLLKSRRFDDVYFSDAGGVAEKRHVFLAGCGLPDAWEHRALYTVGELGFGAGLNFLLTWAAWQRTRAAGARLHYVAVEGFPLPVAAMRDACARWTDLAPLAAVLADLYPAPQRGFQRVHLSDGVTLALMFGEAAAMLRAAEADVDAWYLDGFAPDRNPDMWSPAVMAEIARLSHGGTRVATYTAAGAVRRNLEAAGFAIARVAGFGRKRECLRGVFKGSAVAPRLEPWFARAAARRTGRAAVIGAGIAGASTAYALRQRGWAVTVIDRHGAPAMEGSGNPVGVLMPRVTADDSIEGRFHAAAWRYALALIDRFSAEHLGWHACGVLQVAQDDDDAARLATIAAQGVLAADFMALLSAAEASHVAGCEIARPALLFPQGGTIDPRLWCRALLGDAPVIRMDVAQVEHRESGVTLRGADGTACAADIVVVANALGAQHVADWLPLSVRRGQLTATAAIGAAPQCVLAADATITPAHDGLHWLGATFDFTKDTAHPQAVRDADHARNLAAIEAAFPNLIGAREVRDGRAALRCMSPDHLPIVGPLPDRDAYLRDYTALRHGQHWVRSPDATYVPNVYVLTALGARGLVTAPLAAEVLVSHIAGEPWPLARDVMTALHPARFVVRDIKRMRA